MTTQVSKSTRIGYWAVTGLVSAMNAMSAGMMLFSADAAKMSEHLHFPTFFTTELGVFKALGVLALLLPVPRPIKEWAYAGFAITFISAALSHHFVGDPASNAISPIVALVLLAISRVLYGKVYPAA